MSDETREFELIEVLQFTTGCLLTSLDALYEMANWMTGDDVYTHQLPRVMAECKPFILEAYPMLADVDLPALKRSLAGETSRYRGFRIAKEWVGQESVRLDIPDRLTLCKLPAGAHGKKHPVAEFFFPNKD